jgi:hypothetical protein
VGGADGINDGHSPTRHVQLVCRPDSEDSGSDNDHVVTFASGGCKRRATARDGSDGERTERSQQLSPASPPLNAMLT